MFLSEKVIFVELHKTGGTHIGKWLSLLVGGSHNGKHNRVPQHYRDHFILGSVRNPWDWYVSLWAYGCSNQGAVRRQTCHRYSLRYYWDGLPGEMGQSLLTPQQYAQHFIADSVKPVGRWKRCYTASDNKALFKEWLKLLFTFERRFDIGEGYGFSPVSRTAGLLTYRYLKLFTGCDHELYSDSVLSTHAGRQAAVESRCFVNHFIRNEALEEDLIAGLLAAGVELSEEQKIALLQAKGAPTNGSHRNSTAYYYDDETAALVWDRERLIIDRHNYTFPS